MSTIQEGCTAIRDEDSPNPKRARRELQPVYFRQLQLSETQLVIMLKNKQDDLILVFNNNS